MIGDDFAAIAAAMKKDQPKTLVLSREPAVTVEVKPNDHIRQRAEEIIKLLAQKFKDNGYPDMESSNIVQLFAQCIAHQEQVYLDTTGSVKPFLLDPASLAVDRYDYEVTCDVAVKPAEPLPYIALNWTNKPDAL